MRNIKLTFEYDGTDFVGWQMQTNGRSVQGEVAKVLSQTLQEDVSVIGAGRTDSGVHARGQVANFHTASSLDLISIRSAMNALLPPDVRMRGAEEVPEQFHARYSATSRAYSYRMTLWETAIGRQYHWYVKYSLNIDEMERAARQILGEHVFQSFCKTDTEVNHYRCIVTKSEWTPTLGGFVYEIRANRFLYGMVRALVGTMVDIGRGHTPAATFEEIMESKDRSRAGMAAPPQGLCLEEVTY